MTFVRFVCNMTNKTKARFMNRTERLARSLVEFYGLEIVTGDNLDNLLGHFSPWLIGVKGKKPVKYMSDMYACQTWDELLFGKGHIQSKSLNDCIRDSAFEEMKHKIIDFNSLDELDVQLALVGHRDMTTDGN